MTPKERIIHVLAGAGAVALVFALARPAQTEPPAVAPSAVAPATADAAPPAFLNARDLMRRQLDGWKRPEGPLRVGVQAGHWKNDEAPDEQKGLRENGGSGGGREEWEVALAIAERTAVLLRDRGVEVDVLPTEIPPGYYADAFVSVHADEHPKAAVGGYRSAASWLDFSGTSGALADAIDASYGDATGLQYYNAVTDNMRKYYAFNWLMFDHALHPMTPAAIIETGFMTSPADRKVLFNRPDLAARGIADGVLMFLGMREPENPVTIRP